MTEAEINLSHEMARSKEVSLDLYKNYIQTAITKVRSVASNQT